MRRKCSTATGWRSSHPWRSSLARNMTRPSGLTAAACFVALFLLQGTSAQTERTNPPKVAQPAKIATVDLIVQVGAYDDRLDQSPNGFGHQYDTLVVRVEKVVSGKVNDPWVRIDYWGSNRHHSGDRLPDEIFQPGHRWAMRLTPIVISERNYQFCRPLEKSAITDKDEFGTRYRSVSTEIQDIPEPGSLKCYALTRADFHEVRGSD